jgi:HD-like signal output (HDOD) protein
VRILLVDDDHLLVKALLRSIRLQRPHWRLTPVNSGEAAIVEMAQDSFDLILTDMQMPGIDGTGVLTWARELQPEAIRVILSGHAPQRRILESEGDYHRFLTKPVDPTRLVDIIESFIRHHPDPFRREARAMVVKLERIPSLRNNLDAIGMLLAEGRSSIRAVAEIVAQDLGLALQVLKLVNSGYLPGERPITDIVQAVEFLGFEQIGELIRNRGEDSFTAEGEGPGPLLAGLWAHSLQIGSMASSLVYRETGDEACAAEAFTAGLFHDVGIAVLANLPELGYGQIPLEPATAGAGVIEAERSHCGTDHAEVGAELLHLWGLPEPFIQAVRSHHNPRLPEHETLVSLALHVAHLGKGGELLKPGAPLDREQGDAIATSLWGDILLAWRNRRTEAPRASSLAPIGGNHEC